MKKTILKFRIHLILLFFFPAFCIAQDFKVLDKDDQAILVGITNRSEFQDTHFAPWFDHEYSNYSVDSKTLSKSRDQFEGKIIKIILGTWCSDSRREVPRFVKILDSVGFPFDKVQFINVDRDKKGLYDEVDGLDIQFVPTFIIYENGIEIGRIIETPLESLEKDLSRIVY